MILNEEFSIIIMNYSESFGLRYACLALANPFLRVSLFSWLNYRSLSYQSGLRFLEGDPCRGVHPSSLSEKTQFLRTYRAPYHTIYTLTAFSSKAHPFHFIHLMKSPKWFPLFLIPRKAVLFWPIIYHFWGRSNRWSVWVVLKDVGSTYHSLPDWALFPVSHAFPWDS